MKNLVLVVCILFLSAAALTAKINVVTSYRYIADLTKQICKGKANVQSLAPANWDPHFVVPKPSLIVKVRRADLLIINGAELEIGWIPPIIRDSKNSRIQPGRKGFLDLSRYVKLIDVPETVSRSHGDVHPSGDPHYALDPLNIPRIARALYRRLCRVDPGNCSVYKKNFDSFLIQWNLKTDEWNNSMSYLKGKKVVQYHKLFKYFFKRYGIKSIIEIEPLPGIPPASRHIKKTIDTVKREGISMILTDVYHPQRPARFVAEKTGTRLIVLPHDVGAVKGTDTIFLLFDEIVRRLAK